ncbi:MAG: DUF6712 family protein [Bacteroidales bacterium]
MLFNKEDNGSLELKALIGFIYKSINFDNLISYIGFAERDIKKIIGPEVFEVAQDHYDSDNYLLAEADQDHPEYLILDELVSKLQFPVAVHAYRKYVPSSDLTHSNKGRQIFVSEEEKPAFEWQIEKDNENLLRLAHEATDILLEFLDDHIDDIVTPEPLPQLAEELDLDQEDEPEIMEQEPVLFGDTPDTPLIPWKTSPAFLATRELFIGKVEEFEKVFRIGGSRLVFLSLVPIMRRIQDNEIKSCFSAEKYAELLEDMAGNEISAANAIIIDKIQQPLALLTLSLAAKRLTAEILPDGIFSNLTTVVIKAKNPASKIDRNEVSSSLEKDGMRELRKLQDHMAALEAEADGEIIEAVDFTEHIDATQKFVRL